MKRYFSPDELSGMFTHAKSLRRESVRNLQGVHVRYGQKMGDGNGNHESFQQLNVPPIVVAPVRNTDFMVLNGKHRGVKSIVKGVGVPGYIVETEQEVQHSVPPELFEGLTVKPVPNQGLDTRVARMLRFFSNRESYLQKLNGEYLTLQYHLPEYRSIVRKITATNPQSYLGISSQF